MSMDRTRTRARSGRRGVNGRRTRRATMSGGVVTSSTGGADVDSTRINRDRTRTAIIDTGKLNTGRTSEFGTKRGWQVLWQKTSRD